MADTRRATNDRSGKKTKLGDVSSFHGPLFSETRIMVPYISQVKTLFLPRHVQISAHYSIFPTISDRVSVIFPITKGLRRMIHLLIWSFRRSDHSLPAVAFTCDINCHVSGEVPSRQVGIENFLSETF
jgi:hypothetical protein